MKLTLKKINDHIHTKYPLISVAKHHTADSFWIYSDNVKTSVDLKYLYTQTIEVYKINSITLDQWMARVEDVLRDSCRSRLSARPVTFEYEINAWNKESKMHIDVADSYWQALEVYKREAATAVSRSIETGKEEVMEIICNDFQLVCTSFKTTLNNK